MTGSGTHDGDSSRPALTELASTPGDTLPAAAGQRRPVALAAAATAATASAAADPAGASGGGSASRAHNHLVNSPRTSPAREANRATQLRTVDAGHPSAAAIFRCPAPAALAALHGQAAQLLGAEPDLAARIQALRGHPIVVNAWASWCTPCRAYRWP